MKTGMVEALSHRISPIFCLGPAPRTMEDIEYITKDLGCSIILNVADEKFKVYPELMKRHSIPFDGLFEGAVLRLMGKGYKHIPLSDGKDIPLKKMLEAIAFINLIIKRHGNHCSIYIHCNGGISRTPAVACICFVGFGHDPEETKKYLERTHPITLIHPVLWKSIIKHQKAISGKTNILGDGDI